MSEKINNEIEKDIQNPQRKVKGIWIPIEIWEHEKLSILEKILYAEIISLDNDKFGGCIAGNEYFSKFCGVSKDTISRAIANLKTANLIKQISFNGRIRKLKIVSQKELSDTASAKTESEILMPPKNHKSASAKTESINISNNINNINNIREREESPPLEQNLDLSELTSQPKTENEQLYSEYNQYKNRFKTLIKTYKLGIDKKQIEIICQTERNSIEEWKALKTRMKFDNNNRLLDFDNYARNYLNSTAECYVKPLSWTKFIKFYEKFNKVQVPFHDKLNHHDTQEENRLSNEKFLERINFKEEWTPETIELYKTMIENNEKAGHDVTELKAELEQILREQDEQNR